MRETQLSPDTVCLACGTRIDACSSALGDQVPKSGDVTVCIYCGHVMVFRDGLKLDELSADEARRVAGDRKILAVQRARGEVMRRKAQ